MTTLARFDSVAASSKLLLKSDIVKLEQLVWNSDKVFLPEECEQLLPLHIMHRHTHSQCTYYRVTIVGTVPDILYLVAIWE